MNRIAVIILGLFLFSCIFGNVAAAKEKPDEKKVKYVKSKDGVKALMALARSRGRMIRELKKETKNYEKVKTAIDQGKLKQGEAAARIKGRYGEPVVIVPENGDEFTKWIYKPADRSFSDDGKIYLVFDKNNELVGWHSLQPKEKD